MSNETDHESITTDSLFADIQWVPGTETVSLHIQARDGASLERVPVGELESLAYLFRRVQEAVAEAASTKTPNAFAILREKT